MSTYRMVETRLFRPVSRPVQDAPAQGEWVNDGLMEVFQGEGWFRPLERQARPSWLGQSERELCRWRGHLPNDLTPGPGWELEVEGRRYQVLLTLWAGGNLWVLDVASL